MSEVPLYSNEPHVQMQGGTIFGGVEQKGVVKGVGGEEIAGVIVKTILARARLGVRGDELQGYLTHKKPHTPRTLH